MRADGADTAGFGADGLRRVADWPSPARKAPHRGFRGQSGRPRNSMHDESPDKFVVDMHVRAAGREDRG